jgi:hypothetical protein
MRDEGDRFVAWRLDDAPTSPETDLEDEWVERALLAYAHRSAARVGAEWFAAEFARREEDERLQLELSTQQRRAEAATEPSVEVTLVDASVEDAVVGGAPTGLGLAPPPQLQVVEVEPPPQPETVELEQTPKPVSHEAEPTPEPVSLDVEPAPSPPDVVPEPALQPAAFVAESVPEPAVIDIESAPQPAIRHPHVPRPPAPEPASPSKRRRGHRRRAEAPTPSFVISAPEWARMSPGARRLYGLDASPHAAGTT